MQTKQTQWQFPGAAPPPPGQSVQENITVKEKDHSGGGYGKMALGAAAGVAGGALLAHEGHKVRMLRAVSPFRIQPLRTCTLTNADEHWEEDKYRAEERFSQPTHHGHEDYRREYGYSDYGRRPEYVTEERTEYVNDGPGYIQENETTYIDERPGYARETETTYYDDDYRRGDDYSYSERVEERVDDFPNDAARWTGEKVQEVEDIPQDIEQDFDRAEDRVEDFGDRIEDDFDAGRDEQYVDDAGDGAW